MVVIRVIVIEDVSRDSTGTFATRRAVATVTTMLAVRMVRPVFKVVCQATKERVALKVGNYNYSLNVSIYISI